MEANSIARHLAEEPLTRRPDRTALSLTVERAREWPLTELMVRLIRLQMDSQDADQWENHTTAVQFVKTFSISSFHSYVCIIWYYYYYYGTEPCSMTL